MPERVDLAVLGGGCAGLSLAVHLAEGGLGGRRVVVLEARERYVRDRTWCGFGVRRHRFEGCVTHRWPRWRVRHAGREVLHAAPGLAYEHLPADAFYAEAQRVLGGTPGVELRTGTPVGALRETSGAVEIETPDGPLVAERVVDTRPAPVPEGALLQHFEGWHVRTDTDAFDPSTVTLMDFDVPQEHGVHFAYVLPFGRREALVEATFLGPAVLPSSVYAGCIEGHLRARHGAGIERVLWRERGALPLVAGRPPRGRSRRVLRAGTPAGALKPSAGYAFLNIQRSTEALARELLGRGTPRERPARRRWVDALDAVFLRFLRREPERAPAAFGRLFAAVPAAPLARFLMEEGGAREALRVVRAMPAAPFLRAALAGGAPRWS